VYEETLPTGNLDVKGRVGGLGILEGGQFGSNPKMRIPMTMRSAPTTMKVLPKRSKHNRFGGLQRRGRMKRLAEGRASHKPQAISRRPS
jgi:hypothetical protein